MVTRSFLRRASMAALVMSAAGLMSCAERKDADDTMPLNSVTAAPVTGGTTGVNAEPAARVTAGA